jgi:fructose-specific phosphotransferase system IIA component
MEIWVLGLPEYYCNVRLDPEPMKLSEIITTDCIKIPLSAHNKYEAIEELIDVLIETGRISEKDPLLKAVLDREETRSTGIGQGLAIPHGKCNGLSGLVGAVGIPERPIDFESVDSQLVDFIFLLGSPNDQTGPHIQALARISRLMATNSFRERIANATRPEDVYKALLNHES